MAYVTRRAPQPVKLGELRACRGQLVASGFQVAAPFSISVINRHVFLAVGGWSASLHAL